MFLVGKKKKNTPLCSHSFRWSTANSSSWSCFWDRWPGRENKPWKALPAVFFPTFLGAISRSNYWVPLFKFLGILTLVDANAWRQGRKTWGVRTRTRPRRTLWVPSWTCYFLTMCICYFVKIRVMGFICRCHSHFRSALDNSNIKFILILSLLGCNFSLIWFSWLLVWWMLFQIF